MSSIFNWILANQEPACAIVISFIILLTLRHLFFKRPLSVFLYHSAIGVVCFVLAVGGGGVQNDGYKNLEVIQNLEQKNLLDDVIKHPEKYDRMMRADLKQFKNSQNLEDYLRKYDSDVDRNEAITVGWLFVLFSELCLGLVALIRGFRGIRK